MRRQDATCDSEETGSSTLNKLKTLQQEVPYKIKDRETWEQLSLFPENKENSRLWLQSSLSCDWPSTKDTPQFFRLTCQEHLIHELRSQMTDLHLTGSRPITFHLDGKQRFPSLWHSQKICYDIIRFYHHVERDRSSSASGSFLSWDSLIVSSMFWFCTRWADRISVPWSPPWRHGWPALPSVSTSCCLWASICQSQWLLLSTIKQTFQLLFWRAGCKCARQHSAQLL